MWKSRWPSWAPRPNEPDGFCRRKATQWTMHTHWSQFVPNQLSSTSSSSGGTGRWRETVCAGKWRWLYLHKTFKKRGVQRFVFPLFFYLFLFAGFVCFILLLLLLFTESWSLLIAVFFLHIFYFLLACCSCYVGWVSVRSRGVLGQFCRLGMKVVEWIVVAESYCGKLILVLFICAAS